MESLVRKIKPDEDSKKSKTTKEKIENTLTDELIIGICTPIGSSYKTIIDIIKDKLTTAYNYDVQIIKLSDFILEYCTQEGIHFEEQKGETSAYSNLLFKINNGDKIRKQYNNNSILAELVIRKIRQDRQLGLEVSNIEPENFKSRRICYIIDSLKNLEELKLLRSIYRDIFYLFMRISS